MAQVRVKLTSGRMLFGEMSDTSYAHLTAALRGEISPPHRSEGYTVEQGSRRVQFAPSDVSYVLREVASSTQVCASQVATIKRMKR